MRLHSLDVSGFRGFPQRRQFPLDADAIIVVGANGNGKTSLFDAILWALTGRIPRLTDDNARLVSLYSETGQARVSLTLQDESGKHITALRSFDGSETRFRLDVEGATLHGPSAEGRLIDLIWPEAAAASNPLEALATLLTRCVYLEQDLVHQFIGATTREERFAAVSELIGAGRVTELQSSLEQSKRAWTTVTNQRQEELRPLRDRLTAMDARLAEVTLRASLPDTPISSNDWSAWWERLQRVGVKMVSVALSSREAPSAIDAAIKQLDAARRSAERRIAALTATKNEILELEKTATPDVEAQQKKISELQEQQKQLTTRVSEEQARLAEARRRQTELAEKSAQLKALAELALKHLDDNCPVCQQAYDKPATRDRLEAIVKVDRPSPTASEPDTLGTLLVDLAAKEKELGAAAATLRTQEQALAERRLLRASVEQRITELLGDSPEAGSTALDARASQESTAVATITELQKFGESFALRLSQASASNAAEDLRREAQVMRKEYEARDRQLVERTKTGELAQRVIEAMREASYEVVNERVHEIGPLLQNIWTRIDPHPAFRVVEFLSQTSRGKGQLSTVLSDTLSEKRSSQPTEILSSSQINALAVAVFLALNIGAPKPPLSLAMLDDPLQSLDDVNLLGLVELFRRTRGRRQLLISTHDARFGDLLARKLRPGKPDDRTVLIHLTGWGREGPEVTVDDVRSDPVRLRLVS